MGESLPPVISYDTSPQKPRLNVGDFIFHFLASAMFVGLILLPMHTIQRWKQIFEDFKLELPGPAQFSIDLYDALAAIYAHIWLWAVPFVAPFLLARVRREKRGRLLLLAILVAGLLSFFCLITTLLVFQDLMSGITTKKK
jgi:hypothetical protein